MDSKLKTRLEKAFETLGMKTDATKPMIQSRVRRLKGKYKDDDPEQLKIIEDAEALIMAHEDQLHELRRDDTHELQNDSFNEEKKRKIPYKRIALISMPVILVLVIVSVVTMTVNSRANRYESLYEMMDNFNRFNALDIEEILNDLPENYGNTATIREEFEHIMNEVDVLTSGDPYVDYVEMREAYYRLEDYANGLSDWNLEGYFDSVPNKILLFDIKWVYENYHFLIKPDLNMPDEIDGIPVHPEIFDINLPTGIDTSNMMYTRNYDHTLYGYMIDNDPEDIVITYRILSIDRDELRVFVDGANRTFTLTPE